MKKPGLLSTNEERAAYWSVWLSEAEETLSKSTDEKNWLQQSLYEVTKVAIDNEQYAVPVYEYEEVKRLVEVHIGMPRDGIKKYFNVDTYSIYGTGTYVLIEGIVLTRETRNQIRYDEILTGRKWASYDLSSIPEDILEKYAFNLAVPALGGLFVPKKSKLTEWLHSIRSLKYYDIMG